MIAQRWRVRGLLSGRPARWRVLIWWAAWIGTACIFAGAGSRWAAAQGKLSEIDTEHMFGFTEGSEIGDTGEAELLADTTARFGKGTGVYRQDATVLEAKYTFSERFRMSVAATPAYDDIAGARGLPDRNQGFVQALAFSARYRLLDHDQSRLALTLGVEPHWGLREATSGAPADQLGAEFAALADLEIIPGDVFAGMNLSYAPEWTKLHATGERARDDTLGVGTALSVRFGTGIFVGAEARYFRAYDGSFPQELAGQALYVGPTFYMKLTPSTLFSAAWNVQVWGAAAGLGGNRDLVNFDRQQIKLRLGVTL